jgi:multisubunit Na+/H+ antiporter MnhE subunit
MKAQGDNAQADIVGTIIGLFISIIIIWAFYQVISQINFWLGILFFITAILVIAGALFRR